MFAHILYIGLKCGVGDEVPSYKAEISGDSVCEVGGVGYGITYFSHCTSLFKTNLMSTDVSFDHNLSIRRARAQHFLFESLYS